MTAAEAKARAAALADELRDLGSEENRAGMARFGINSERAAGVSVVALRRIARREGRDHALALALWATGLHEARILASMVDEPDRVTEAQMERWAHAFDSWDLCDQVCGNLFDRTPFAYAKAREWATREPEFEKRAGFALVACLARHDKAAPDARFVATLPLIEVGATDERNFVKKAVSWALREVGKRNARLNAEAVTRARRILALDSKAARWVARDALRELEGEAVRARLGMSR